MAGGFRFDSKPGDAAWHPDDSEDFFELWDCYCMIDGGYGFAIMLYSKPWYPIIDYIPGEAGHPLCVINIITPDGVSHFIRKSYPDEAFKASTERLDVTMGQNRLIGKYNDKGEYEGIEIKIAEEGISAELTYDAKIGSMKMSERDDNLTYLNPATNKYFGWFNVGVRSDVKGTITIDGKAMDITGVGSNNYNWGNIKFDLQSRWFTAGIFADDYTISFNNSTAGKRHNYAHFTPLVLWKGNEVIMSTFNCSVYGEEFAVDPESRGPYPVTETFRASEGDIEVMGFLPPGIIAERSRIEDVPGLACTSENPWFHFFQFSDAHMIIRRGKEVEKIKGRALREFVWADEWFPYKR